MGRISRLKSQKRTLLTYKVHFDIVPPYNIVGALLWRARLIAPAVDPAFLMEALKIDMKLRQVLPKLMGGVTYAKVTECIVAELFAMGEEHRDAAIFARRMLKEECTHKGQRIGAQKCIEALLGKTNPKQLCVAANDRTIKASVESVRGTPILCIVDTILQLDAPSYVTKSHIARKLDKQERAEQDVKLYLSTASTRLLTAAEAAGAAPPPKKTGTMPKRAKAPNPLSVKKPSKRKRTESGESAKAKKRKLTAPTTTATTAATSTHVTKPKRRRVAGEPITRRLPKTRGSRGGARAKRAKKLQSSLG